MAKNIIFEDTNTLRVAVTAPTTPVSGDPVLFGDRAGVALTDKSSTSGRTTVKFEGVAELSVKGVDGSGNSAVKEGDVLYYVAGDTPVLSKKPTGVRFGVAVAKPTDTAGANLIAAGSTAVIRVHFGL